MRWVPSNKLPVGAGSETTLQRGTTPQPGTHAGFGERATVQLTVREVSKFLNVAESTVIRWIKQRGLPAQHVGGQYRFHRAELLEWATANRIKVSLEMFDSLEAEEEPPPSLAEALEGGGVFYHLPDTNKVRALRALVEVLPIPSGVDRELLLRLFLAREASATTAIGDGIALPHVRNPIVLHVACPLVTLGFLEEPVDFGALDGKPVYALFSLVCPTMRSHLQMLARLSYALHDSQFKEVVRRQGKREEILQEARRVEDTLRGSGKAGIP
jgi:nitrogen PTS system EIIA component